MSPNRKSAAKEPPQPRRMRRWIELAPVQIVGMLFLAGVLVAGAMGALGDAGAARESIWRVTFVYVFLMAAFRLSGKREIGQMSPFELVTLLLIPEILSSALNRGDESLSLATVGVGTLSLLVFFTGLLTFRSRKMEAVLDGEPAILVRHGQFVERNLRRERVTPEEVFTEMHLAGIERLEDVRWAILESEGKIAIVPAASTHHKKKTPEEG